jgi:hypothetical protein
MKKYYLYRGPILNPINDLARQPKGHWSFDDEFDSYEAALNQAKLNAERASWKVWKIEEVWDFL